MDLLAGWICSHNILLSVIMSLVTIIGIAAICFLIRSIHGKLSKLYKAHFSADIREEIENGFAILLLIGVIGGVGFVLFEACKGQGFVILLTLLSIIIGLGFCFGLAYVAKIVIEKVENKPIMKSIEKKVDKVFKKTGSTIEIIVKIFIAAWFLGVILFLLHELYIWWVLHICQLL